MKLFKQSTILPTWIGAIFVQLQMSLLYVGIANIFMLAITMWYTAGHQIAEKYVPFITTPWQVIIILVIGWSVVIYYDYKFIIPAKQRYLNQQAAKHKNIVLELLEKMDKDNNVMRADIAKIKETLGIKDG